MRWLWYIVAIILSSCTDDFHIDRQSSDDIGIFPDYKELIIPYNIAPLNFGLADKSKKLSFVRFETNGGYWDIPAKSGQIYIPESRWHKWLSDAKGAIVKVTVVTEEGKESIGHKSFEWQVAPEPIDPYLVYRLIEPGYEIWNKMGIYQRCLETFRQTPILENTATKNNCMNCHSFCNRSPELLSLHLRASLGGTVIQNGKRIEVTDTKTEETISPLVYPYWHPSGKYVAFSTNKTSQLVHQSNRVEVFDMASDVVVYDIKRHQIISSPRLASKHSFETFPSFSQDGRTLYFCSAPATYMPDSMETLHYSLCSVPFNESEGTFGSNIDTIYRAEDFGKSFLFPRISPDNQFILGTVTEYGTFPIWHKDADLCMIDLKSNSVIMQDKANSYDADSYHCWSSNGKWVVFSSRRLDGLYTRPFISYVSDTGELQKPFLLPQRDVNHYDKMMKSYNIPELVTGKVTIDTKKLRKTAEHNKTKVLFKKVF